MVHVMVLRCCGLILPLQVRTALARNLLGAGCWVMGGWWLVAGGWWSVAGGCPVCWVLAPLAAGAAGAGSDGLTGRSPAMGRTRRMCTSCE